MKKIGLRYSLIALSCLFIAACGGGSGGSGNAPSSGSTNNNTQAQGPAVADNVFLSYTLPASASAPNDNEAVVTVSKDGIVRAFGSGEDQALTIAAGTMPLTGNSKTATGGGWLAYGNTFEPAALTLNANADGTSFTLIAKGVDTQASNSTLTPISIVTTPTEAALAGQYGIQGAGYGIDIEGTSLTGTFSLYCAFSGTLSPNNKTVDVTDVTFQTSVSPYNPNGIVCPYAGKSFNGTAYLLGPSAAYPKGTFQIILDDSAYGTPTMVLMSNFPRQ